MKTRKVKMLQSIAGGADARYNLSREWSFAPGEVATIDKTLAELWIAGGIAQDAEETTSKK